LSIYNSYLFLTQRCNEVKVDEYSQNSKFSLRAGEKLNKLKNKKNRLKNGASCSVHHLAKPEKNQNRVYYVGTEGRMLCIFLIQSTEVY
jgi:hypothetical protein